jgi:hypothetical protein
VSIEYRATCTADDAWIEALSEELGRDSRFVVLARDPIRLSLRLAKNPLRAQWPEDVDVRLDDAGIYVAFHGGTSADRADVLGILQQALARSGRAASFEEL